jgi:hypothetical protein
MELMSCYLCHLCEPKELEPLVETVLLEAKQGFPYLISFELVEFLLPRLHIPTFPHLIGYSKVKSSMEKKQRN